MKDCNEIKKRLLTYAKQRKLYDGVFDELVHDLKSSEASDINNGGLEDQIEYLMEKLSEKEIEEEISKLTEPPSSTTVQSILALVCIEVDITTIDSWTDEQKDQAIKWAGAVHLHASDNDDVDVPKKPDFLPAEAQYDGVKIGKYTI